MAGWFLKVGFLALLMPGSCHGIAGRPSRLITKVEHILAWFGRYRSDQEAHD